MSQLTSQISYLRSTNAINFPVLPPTFPSALPRVFAAPLIAGPADEVTFDRPSEAFDWRLEAACEAFAVVSFAESAALLVVDSNLLAVRPRSFVDCRGTAREMANDMMEIGQDREMPEEWVGEQFGVKREMVRDCTFFAGPGRNGKSRAKD